MSVFSLVALYDMCARLSGGVPARLACGRN